MKRTNIYIILLGVLMAIFATSANASSKNEALYKKLNKSYVLNEDGSQEMRFQQELTIYTHTAMGFYGQTFVVYNPDFQEVVINESYTTQVDGTVIRTPENAYINVLPKSAANAPAYNHLIEKVIVHTGLELGATIYLDYTLKTKAGYLPALDIFENVEQTSPVKNFALSVTVPKSSPLNYTTINANHTPKFIESGAKKEITWRLKNLAASSREPGFTVQSKGIQIISANTFKPSEVEETFINLLSGDDSAAKKMLMHIFRTRSLFSESEMIGVIQKFVKDNYSFIPLSFKDAGYKMRSVSEVVKSAYGTEAELTQLTYSLLKAKGIKAEIVASYPTKSGKLLGMSAINELFILTGDSNLISVKGSKLIEADYKILKSLTGEKVIDLATQNSNISEGYDLTVGKKDAKSIGNNYYLYTLPQSPKAIANQPYLKYNSKRKENLLLPYKINESYTYELELDGLTLASKLKNKSIKNKVGEVIFSIKKDGNKVTITKSIEIPNQLITPALYTDFRALVTEWGDDNIGKLLLK